MKTKLTSMKTQITTLHNGSRNCAMTQPVPGRKPVLALLMRPLWAAVLALPTVGAQAQQVKVSSVSPTTNEYTVVSGGDFALLVVSTTSANPAPFTTQLGWTAQVLTPSWWVLPMPGGSTQFPAVSWQSYTGLSWDEAFPPGTTLANGYFRNYHLVFSQGCNCQAVYYSNSAQCPPLPGGYFFQGAPESSAFLLTDLASPCSGGAPPGIWSARVKGTTEIVPTPELTIIPSGANVILTWPTNAAGFTLEFATNLVSPAVWQTNSTGPVIINGQNVVTNPITGTQMFFRLQQ